MHDFCHRVRVTPSHKTSIVGLDSKMCMLLCGQYFSATFWYRAFTLARSLLMVP